MFRALTLVASILAFVVAGYGYFMALRRAPDAERAERIVTWGAHANTDAWTPESERYRTMMRWGSPLGLVLFIIWAWLSA